MIETTIVFAISFVAFLLLLMNDMKALLIAYSMLFLCLVSLFYFSFRIAPSKEHVLLQGFPFYIILAVLIWIIILTIVYYKDIVHKNVPEDFYSCISAVHILLMIQFIMLFYYISESELNTSNNSKKSTNNMSVLVIYLVSTLNVAFIGVCNLILNYYTTDG